MPQSERSDSRNVLANPMDRRRFLKMAGSAGAVVGLGPLLAACGGGGGGGGRTVKIGLISTQTGPLAPFGETDKYTVDAVQAFVADGIDIGGTTHPVEIILKDTESDPTRAAQITQEVIDGGVDVLIPGFTPDITNAVGDTAEANGVPMVGWAAPWQPWFFRNADVTPATVYEWQYHFFWGLEDIIQVFLDMWNQVDTNKTIGALWPNDPDGNAWSNAELGFPPALEAAGYTVVDPGRYENGTDDFSPQISQFKSAGVEIITGVPIPPDFPTFWTQAAQQDFHPKAVAVGKALLFPSSVDALGEAGDGLSTEVWWHPTLPFSSSLTDQSAQELADAYTSDTGKQWTQPLGYAHAGLEVALDALKRTTDIDDPAAVRDAIKATNLDTVAGHVSWANDQLAKVGDALLPNVAKMKLAGGQWTATSGGDFAYDLVIVSNSIFPDAPVGGSVRQMPGS
jgi:branched-chain amino acid transport system substrate-binding protein